MADRHCCDGRCNDGLGCPAFAPGVIDGPHRPKGSLMALLRAMGRAAWRLLSGGWSCT